MFGKTMNAPFNCVTRHWISIPTVRALSDVGARQGMARLRWPNTPGPSLCAPPSRFAAVEIGDRPPTFRPYHSRPPLGGDHRGSRREGRGEGGCSHPESRLESSCSRSMIESAAEEVLAGLAIGGRIVRKADGGCRPKAIREIPASPAIDATGRGSERSRR